MLKMGNFCLRPFDGFCARLTTFCARFAHDLSPCFSPKYELWPQKRPKVKPVTFVTGRPPKLAATLHDQGRQLEPRPGKGKG